MAVFKDEELEKVFNKLERVDINKIEPDDAKYIVYASAGAMGSPGDFIIITSDIKVSENNFVYGNITSDDIIKFIPEFKELDYKNYLGQHLANWVDLDMGYGNYLFVNREIFKHFYESLSFYMQLKDDEYDSKELYCNWLYGVLYSLKTQEKFVFKENKLSNKDLMNLKEEDLMFITNPGRMYDIDGSTFVIKKDNNYILYRVDDLYIFMKDMFKIFPKWEDAWNNYYKKGYNDKYVYIYMGFGTGLCIDKRIFDKYLPYLKKEVIKNGWEFPDDLSSIIFKDGEACPGVAGSWIQALENMINDDNKI